MSILKKYNGKIISLGSNCYVKIFLNDILKYKDETQFFDYIGSSMWSINELIKNNFDNLFNIDNFEKKQILYSGDKYIFTNNQYYLRFKHDIKQNYYSSNNDLKKNDFIELEKKYNRRKERFIKLLNNDDDNILFIRYEEDNFNRVLYYTDKKKEIEYIKEFIKLIKKKVLFIFLSHTTTDETNIDDNNILIIKIEPIRIWTEAGDKINNILLQNKELINYYIF